MKRYVFNLSAVLRVRKVELALSRQSIAAVSQKYFAVGQDILRLEERYDSAMQSAENSGEQPTLLYLEQASRIYNDIVARKKDLAKLQELLNREKLLGIERERKVEVLENIDRERKLAWLHECDREESILLDEIGSTKSLIAMQKTAKRIREREKLGRGGHYDN